MRKNESSMEASFVGDKCILESGMDMTSGRLDRICV